MFPALRWECSLACQSWRRLEPNELHTMRESPPTSLGLPHLLRWVSGRLVAASHFHIEAGQYVEATGSWHVLVPNEQHRTKIPYWNHSWQVVVDTVPAYRE